MLSLILFTYTCFILYAKHAKSPPQRTHTPTLLPHVHTAELQLQSGLTLYTLLCIICYVMIFECIDARHVGDPARDCRGEWRGVIKDDLDTTSAVPLD